MTHFLVMYAIMVFLSPMKPKHSIPLLVCQNWEHIGP